MSTARLIESYYIERFKEGQALAESGSFHYAGTLSVRVYFTRNSLVVEVVKVTFLCNCSLNFRAFTVKQKFKQVKLRLQRPAARYYGKRFNLRP